MNVYEKAKCRRISRNLTKFEKINLKFLEIASWNFAGHAPKRFKDEIVLILVNYIHLRITLEIILIKSHSWEKNDKIFWWKMKELWCRRCYRIPQDGEGSSIVPVHTAGS